MAEAAQIPEKDRVYVDESGINDDLKREYGRAPRGARAEDCRRGRKFHRVNIVAGQTHDGAGARRLAPLCCQGTVNGERFEARFENSLSKTVEKGKTAIMDNASFHRKKQLGEACKKHEVHLLYLPPYSPDYNPVEKTWANMKRELRSAAPLHGLIETAIYAYLG